MVETHSYLVTEAVDKTKGLFATNQIVEASAVIPEEISWMATKATRETLHKMNCVEMTKRGTNGNPAEWKVTFEPSEKNCKGCELSRLYKTTGRYQCARLERVLSRHDA